MYVMNMKHCAQIICHEMFATEHEHN